eukprot:PLAT5311.1.p1 GENE.PLAT5311.1~~PLAT5311.1.p1  ORF type:complete len:529 (+),score=88.98 PLAT5311.1:178-1764(+)
MGGVFSGKEHDARERPRARGYTATMAIAARVAEREFEAGEHALARMPEDVMSIFVSLLDVADCLALAVAHSTLLPAVLSRLESISVDWFHSCPVPLLHSLQRVRLGKAVQLSIALPALQSCTRLRQLACHNGGRQASEFVLLSLPRFCALQTVHLQAIRIDAQLGSALAQCACLRELQLSMHAPRVAEDGHVQSAAEFMRELQRCRALRSLCGIHLRNARDVEQLCSSLCAWRLLEELQVTIVLATTEVALVKDVFAALADCCPGLHTLAVLVPLGLPHPLHHAATALASMSSLRRLQVEGFRFDDAFFAALGDLTTLQSLSLHRCWVTSRLFGGLNAVIARNPLTLLHVHLVIGMPSVGFMALLRTIALHDRLQSVAIDAMDARWAIDGERDVSIELARAISASSLLQWKVRMPLSPMAFLLALDAAPPAKRLHSLDVRPLHVGYIHDPAVLLPLLLGCFRSWPSLRAVTLELTMSDTVLAAFVKDVLKQSLLPVRLTLIVATAVKRRYREVEDAMMLNGLRMQDGG